MKHRQKRLFIVFLFLLLIASSCQTQGQQIGGLKIQDMRDVVTFSSMYADRDNNVIIKNLLIDKNSKLEEEVELTGGTFFDILPMQDLMSVSQYYSSRLIMGGLNGGGRSIEVVKDEHGGLSVIEHPFNIVFYDEIAKKYITQTIPEDGAQGFNILDEKLNKVDFIPLPVLGEEINSGFVQPYNLDTILYVGDADGKKYQVKQYDMKEKQWKDIAQLLEQEVYDGYFGYAHMSYNDKYPDWASFTIGTLAAPDKAAKEINTLYFVNLKTGEIKTEALPLFAVTPIVTMPGMPVSVMKTKDRVAIIDMNPDGVKVLDELYVEELIPFGEQHINSVLQYNTDDILIRNPNGILKYDFKTKQSEYVYTTAVEGE
jgi:hypothetical protein